MVCSLYTSSTTHNYSANSSPECSEGYMKLQKKPYSMRRNSVGRHLIRQCDINMRKMEYGLWLMCAMPNVPSSWYPFVSPPISTRHLILSIDSTFCSPRAFLFAAEASFFAVFSIFAVVISHVAYVDIVCTHTHSILCTLEFANTRVTHDLGRCWMDC